MKTKTERYNEYQRRLTVNNQQWRLQQSFKALAAAAKNVKAVVSEPVSFSHPKPFSSYEELKAIFTP